MPLRHSDIFKEFHIVAQTCRQAYPVAADPKDWAAGIMFSATKAQSCLLMNLITIYITLDFELNCVSSKQ